MTWIRRAFSTSGPVLRFALPASLILAATLLVRHGDGSVAWDKLASLFGRAPQIAHLVSGVLLGLILLGLWAGKSVTRILSLLLPFTLGAAAWVNAGSFAPGAERERYSLELRQNPTMLDISSRNPSEFENTDLGLYLFMHRECEGKTISAFASGLLAEHYLKHVAHVASFKIAEYPHELDATAARQIESRPHVERRDGRGRPFLFLTDDAARAARSFHLMQGPDKFYVLPGPPPQQSGDY